MSDKKKSNVLDVELLLIKDMPSKSEAGAGAKLRVVQWVYAAGRAVVKLEKRAYYTAAGKVMPGKAEGFTLEDLAHLHPKWGEMIRIMKNPPKPPALPAPASKQDDDVIEEVPF